MIRKHLFIFAILCLCSSTPHEAGHRPDDVSSLPSHHKAEQARLNDYLPTEFTWQSVEFHGSTHNFLTSNWNQHIPVYCGSCWLHGALTAINDRFKVFSLAYEVDVKLSRQTLLNCGQSRGFGHGCDGGNPSDVFGYLTEYGLPDETCMVYSAQASATCNPIDICMDCWVLQANTPSVCWAVTNPKLYYVNGYNKITRQAINSGEREKKSKKQEKERKKKENPNRQVLDASELKEIKDPTDRDYEQRRINEIQLAIMTEIYSRGPVVCAMATSNAFDFGYKGGVWQQAGTEVNHDVEVIGWGDEFDVFGRKVPYWHVRNSWGSYWGEGGFFKVLRGGNMLIIENDCWFANPSYTKANNGTKPSTQFIFPHDHRNSPNLLLEHFSLPSQHANTLKRLTSSQKDKSKFTYSATSNVGDYKDEDEQTKEWLKGGVVTISTLWLLYVIANIYRIKLSPHVTKREYEEIDSNAHARYAAI